MPFTQQGAPRSKMEEPWLYLGPNRPSTALLQLTGLDTWITDSDPKWSGLIRFRRQQTYESVPGSGTGCLRVPPCQLGTW